MSMAPQVEPGNEWLECRYCGNIWVLGRLKPGVTRAQARASLQRVAHQLAHDYPKENEGTAIELTTPGLIGNASRWPNLPPRRWRSRVLFCCLPASTSPACCWPAHRIDAKRSPCGYRWVQVGLDLCGNC
jgi:hypothetical protein